MAFRYNAGASCIRRTSSGSNNAAAQQSPPRPYASKTKTGAASLSPPSKGNSGLRHHSNELKILKDRLPRRKLTINGKRKRISHYIWWLNTGHWPVWPEIIHHRDGDSLNDSFSNLQLMSTAEHSALHNSDRPHSEESNAKRSATLIGHPVSEESKAKMSAAKMGDRNPSWKGDDATPQSKYTRIWRARKKEQSMKPMAKRKTILGPSVPREYHLLMPSSPPPSKEVED